MESFYSEHQTLYTCFHFSGILYYLRQWVFDYLFPSKPHFSQTLFHFSKCRRLSNRIESGIVNVADFFLNIESSVPQFLVTRSRYVEGPKPVLQYLTEYWSCSCSTFHWLQLHTEKWRQFSQIIILNTNFKTMMKKYLPVQNDAWKQVDQTFNIHIPISHFTHHISDWLHDHTDKTLRSMKLLLLETGQIELLGTVLFNIQRNIQKNENKIKQNSTKRNTETRFES